MTTITINERPIEIDGQPNKCPYCHNSISPNIQHGHLRNGIVEVLFECPDNSCKRGFLGYYGYNEIWRKWQFNGQVTQGVLLGREFTDTISKKSNSFSVIFNQAYSAEQQGLSEICGVGYRKALEFLIKDYAIFNNPGSQEIIEKKLLATCITEFIDDTRIKTVAKRAVWLDNDETHYIRKWEGKNLEDLKKLIDLTSHWIEMEALTKSFENDMPE